MEFGDVHFWNSLQFQGPIVPIHLCLEHVSDVSHVHVQRVETTLARY